MRCGNNLRKYGGKKIGARKPSKQKNVTTIIPNNFPKAFE
jgi:hypothetical protein